VVKKESPPSGNAANACADGLEGAGVMIRLAGRPHPAADVDFWVD
jgi:hypothetical protein